MKFLFFFFFFKLYIVLLISQWNRVSTPICNLFLHHFRQLVGVLLPGLVHKGVETNLFVLFAHVWGIVSCFYCNHPEFFHCK